MINNLQLQIEKICLILEKSLSLFNEYVPFSYYFPQIIKSGIKKFIDSKYYLDTSSINGINNIDTKTIITYHDRPSRANMELVCDSVWFAKMKDSNKKLIITKNDQDLIDKYILSTGFLGIKSSNNLSLSFLSSIIISKEFNKQKNLNCVGTTMSSINNETLLKIFVSIVSKQQLKQYDDEYKHFIDLLSLFRRKIEIYKK